MSQVTREQALALLQKYNKEPFHIQHALTVEGVMRWYAQQNGENVDFWGLVGLLHDIDFERWPEEHCKKAPELLKEGGCSEEFIHAVCSHGYGLCCDVAPQHEMEKVLFAADELTGLIGAAARALKVANPADLEKRAHQLEGELKELKKELESANAKLSAAKLSAIIQSYPNTFAVMSSVGEVMGNFKSLNTDGTLVRDVLDHGDGKTL
mgnify:CR=1 FL=1